jgi:hypothetical protein
MRTSLTGTYGTPLIADGKVTSAKIADGAITTSKFNSAALAPNSDKLDGRDSSEFATIVGRGAFDAGSVLLAAGQCTIGGTSAPAGTDPATDFVLAQPPARSVIEIQQLSVTGGFGTLQGDLLVMVTVCNGSGGDLRISGTFKWLVLRSG